MIIRKQYKFEAAHKVANCPSNRCSKNIHGHSFIIEVKIGSNFLDAGGMVMDFGLLKETVGQFLDWFDHSIMVWSEDNHTMEVAAESNERICILPFNTTAENLSKVIFMAVQNILSQTHYKNAEVGVSLHSIKVHETATGYAECFYGDIHTSDWAKLKEIIFTHVDSDHFLFEVINLERKYENPIEVN